MESRSVAGNSNKTLPKRSSDLVKKNRKRAPRSVQAPESPTHLDLCVIWGGPTCGGPSNKSPILFGVSIRAPGFWKLPRGSGLLQGLQKGQSPRRYIGAQKTTQYRVFDIRYIMYGREHMVYGI